MVSNSEVWWFRIHLFVCICLSIRLYTLSVVYQESVDKLGDESATTRQVVANVIEVQKASNKSIASLAEQHFRFVEFIRTATGIGEESVPIPKKSVAELGRRRDE